MSYRMPRNLALPPVTSLAGPKARGSLRVTTSKPPKLRFRPGSIVRLDGALYEVMFAYRVSENPHEWYYDLEERESLTGKTGCDWTDSRCARRWSTNASDCV